MGWQAVGWPDWVGAAANLLVPAIALDALVDGSHAHAPLRAGCCEEHLACYAASPARVLASCGLRCAWPAAAAAAGVAPCTHLCTPPMPPVTNTLMPARCASSAVAETVVAPSSCLAHTRARSLRATFSTSEPLRAMYSICSRSRPALKINAQWSSAGHSYRHHVVQAFTRSRASARCAAVLSLRTDMGNATDDSDCRWYCSIPSDHLLNFEGSM